MNSAMNHAIFCHYSARERSVSPKKDLFVLRFYTSVVRFLLTLGNHPGHIENSIGKRALTVIDVRNDTEVPDVLEILRQSATCLASHQAHSNTPPLTLFRGRGVQGHLARKLVLMTVEDEIDTLADVHRHGHFRALVQELESLVLLGGDVDRRRDLFARHLDLRSGMKLHGTIYIVNPIGRGLAQAGGSTLLLWGFGSRGTQS